MKNPSIISAKNLKKIYPMGKTTVHALRGLNIDVQKGEYLCIAGPSGAGKSTLLNMIGMLDRPSDGSILIDGEDILALKAKAFHRFRRKRIAFIFQSFNLIPVLTAFENIEFPLIFHKYTKAERSQAVLAVAEEVGIREWLHHKPDELSGGQRQRVAIARALVTKPEIIIADEPTANLDSKTGHIILDLMRKLNKEEQTTFIVAAHDDSVMNEADRLLHVIDGVIDYA